MPMLAVAVLADVDVCTELGTRSFAFGMFWEILGEHA
jgi:hypothetical protein